MWGRGEQIFLGGIVWGRGVGVAIQGSTGTLETPSWSDGRRCCVLSEVDSIL